ncbi:LytTR family DNA-binding domain-containing protein [Roseibium sp. HPY-6]|uniref:LytTR family DNA-binding domain-containing protein n=1 Tax=Roseibium sp. HPY-6 TaxID=3229852 RepID=UPI00338ECFE8
MREIDVVFDPERKLFLYFGITFIAIGVGPFGTYETMTLWQRAVFWSLDILGCALIVVPILHVFYFSRLAGNIPSFPRFVLGIALAALPAAGYISVLYGMVGDRLEITTPYPLLYVQVTIFSILLLLTEFVLWPALFGNRQEKRSATDEDVSEAAEAAPATLAHKQLEDASLPLMSRLPHNVRQGSVVSISMQDHYAEVTLTTGKALILMRLSDAIDLLEGYPGVRVHRSHWVAQQFLTAIERRDRGYRAVLEDGRDLPVSATYLEAARQQLVSGAGVEPV